MARQIVVGSVITISPSEGSVTDYAYTLSNVSAGSVTEEGVFTALSPGQTVLTITRTIDQVVIRRVTLQVVTQEQLDAVGAILPTFTLQIQSPLQSHITNVQLSKSDRNVVVNNILENYDNVGFFVTWDYVPSSGDSDNWATELYFRVEVYNSDNQVITNNELQIIRPKFPGETQHYVNLSGRIPPDTYAARVTLLAMSQNGVEDVEYLTESSTTSNSVTVTSPLNSYSVGRSEGIISQTLSGGGMEVNGIYITDLQNWQPNLQREKASGEIVFGGAYQQNPDYGPWRAFDGQSSTMFNNDFSDIEKSLGYVFQLPRIVKGLTAISVTTGSSEIVPDNWQYTSRFFKLQGSNDTTDGSNGTWVDIQVLSLPTWTGAGQSQTVSITNDDAYLGYKLVSTDNSQLCFGELNFLGY